MVRDLISDERLLVGDVGLSTTAVAGTVLASRLSHREGFAMLGGAALPLGVLPLNELDAFKRAILRMIKPNKKDRFDPAALIRQCLRSGCSDRIEYAEPGERIRGRR